MIATPNGQTNGWTQLTDEQLEKHYPSIPLAYDFVRPAYDVMAKRFEIVEARIRALLTIVVTVTFGAPVFVKAILPGVHFDTLSFSAALAVLTINLLLGVRANLGEIILVVSPKLLADERMLALNQLGFKQWVLYRAGETFEVNSRALRKKSHTADLMALLLIVEAIFLAIWALVDH